MDNHMKEHLIGKVVKDVKHIYSYDVYGEVQTGMKFTFEDGTNISVMIEIDNELNDRPNLDWKIEYGKEDKGISKNEKHYLIIGGYINIPIGCCSEEGIADVKVEEPNATFEEISVENCPICDELRLGKEEPK